MSPSGRFVVGIMRLRLEVRDQPLAGLDRRPSLARRGQSLVVWAINEGRGAARECDRWLMGETELP
jgi:hypothetical protein